MTKIALWVPSRLFSNQALAFITAHEVVFLTQDEAQNSLATRAAEAVAALQEVGRVASNSLIRISLTPIGTLCLCQVATPAAPVAPSQHVASTGAGAGIIQLLQKLGCGAYPVAAGSVDGCHMMSLDGQNMIYFFASVCLLADVNLR